MGLLERVIQARWPAGPGEVNRLESELGHRDEFGPPEYGDYIATSNDIYSVINLRAKHMGSLPLNTFRGRDEEKIHVTEGPLADLLRKVNPFWTFQRLMRMTEMSMGLWGEGFWAVERGGGLLRQPRELWWLKSPRVHPVPSADGYIAGFLYDGSNGEQIPFRPDEIIWFRYPNPLDEFAGLSPLAPARLSADAANGMMKSNKNLFTQGMQMGGVVVPAKDKVTFSAEQAEDLEHKLEKRFKGVDKAHRWGVLRYEAQFLPMAISPKDAQFVEGMNVTFRQVCRTYGVPSPLLYDLEHATLANLRELQQELWQDTLVPEAQFYAADLEEQLLPMFRVGRGAPRQPDHVEWDFSHVPALQESSTNVWDRERQAIEAGALTINEWRKKHGLPPVSWGDTWYAPMQKAPVETLTGSSDQGQTSEERSQALGRALIADTFDDFDRQIKALTNGHGART